MEAVDGDFFDLCFDMEMYRGDVPAMGSNMVGCASPRSPLLTNQRPRQVSRRLPIDMFLKCTVRGSAGEEGKEGKFSATHDEAANHHEWHCQGMPFEEVCRVSSARV
jgi:hypothetical protein